MAIYDSTGDGFSTPQVIARRSEYPFWSEGDTQCRLIYDTIIVLETAYQPLSLDTPHPTIAGAFLVEETPPASLESGWVQYERVYATLGLGFITYGAANFEFSGVSGSVLGADLGVAWSLDIVKESSAVTTYWLVAPLTPQRAFVSFSYVAKNIYDSTTYTSTQTGLRSLSLNKNGKTGFSFFNVINSDSKTLRPVSFTIAVAKAAEFYNRSPKNETVWAKTETSFLREFQINDYTIINKFRVYTATGTETTTITTTTLPSITEYSQKIQNREWIPAQDTIITRWKGRIYRADTTYVQAK